MRARWLGLAAVAAFVMTPASASANIILIGQSLDSGTGFGNVTNILTLQNNGTEVGSVKPDGPDGGSQDDITGDAANTSDFLTFTELAAVGITSGADFGIVYNVNQNTQLYTQLNSFSIDVYSATGLFLQSFTYTGPSCDTTTGVGCFDPISTNGSGTAGYLFGFDAAQAAQFDLLMAANPGGGVGMSGNISLSNDGPESFFAIDRQSIPPDVLPEPGAVLLLGTGVLMLGRRLRRRS